MSYSASYCQDRFSFKRLFYWCFDQTTFKEATSLDYSSRGSGIVGLTSFPGRLFTTAMMLILIPDLTQDRGHDHMEPSISASPHIPFHGHYFLHNYIVFFLLSVLAMKNCTKYFFPVILACQPFHYRQCFQSDTY